MARIKKNDTVKLLAGKDKGKSGKVIFVYPKIDRALVQGLNLVKKHARRTKEDQQGGIIQKESPVNLSNLMVVCQKCAKPAKVSFNTLSDGTKVRICRKCKELV